MEQIGKTSCLKITSIVVRASEISTTYEDFGQGALRIDKKGE
jgi:hypothetical protein